MFPSSTGQRSSFPEASCLYKLQCAYFTSHFNAFFCQHPLLRKCSISKPFLCKPQEKPSDKHAENLSTGIINAHLADEDIQFIQTAIWNASSSRLLVPQDTICLGKIGSGEISECPVQEAIDCPQLFGARRKTWSCCVSVTISVSIWSTSTVGGCRRCAG